MPRVIAVTARSARDRLARCRSTVTSSPSLASSATSRRSRSTPTRVAEPQHLLQLGGDEQHRHAVVGRAERTSLWISALAPTSMPRVGSSRISSRGSVISQRASSTFCWLPPLSVADDLARGRRGRMSSALMYLATSSSCAARGIGRVQPRPACSARMMFSRTVSSATRPSVLRFSGAERDPVRRSRARGLRIATGSPSTRDLAAVGAVGAEQQPRELGAAGAEQAGQADDLALVDRRGRTARSRPCGRRPRASSTGVAASSVGELAGARSSCLQRLRARGRSSSRPARPGRARRSGTRRRAAVAQHGDPVGRSRRPGRGSAMTNRIAMPSLLAAGASPRRAASTSLASRLEVGSSRISTLASMSIARAIATSCWTASE